MNRKVACANCGQEINDTELFCMFCGTAQPVASDQPAASLAEQFQRITQRLDDLAHRVGQIEERLEIVQPSVSLPTEATSPQAVAPPPPPMPAPPAPRREPPPMPAPAPTPLSPSASASPSNAVEWESLIGGKWALWVGSVAVFFAVAFFLAYAWRYLSQEGRLAIGFVVGGLFLAGGGYARHKVQGWFSEGLTGAGLGILYLTIWAGAQHYGILSFEVAFVLMAVTTALGVTLALFYDAVSLTTLATVGGFLTPALLRSPGGGVAQAVPLLTYVLILNGGILAVSLFKRWRGIVWLSFGATILLVLGWAALSYSAALRWPLFVFVTFYFLLFLGAACFYSLIRREQTAPQDLIFLFIVAFCYAVAGFAITHGGLSDYPGLFPLTLAAFFGGVSVLTRILAAENATLRHSTGGLALLFLTITFPIQLEQGWLTIAWSVQAAVMLTLGWRFQSSLLLRAGQIVWVLSLFSLALRLFVAEPLPKLLLINDRALPLLISVLDTAWMAILSGRRTPAQPATAEGKDDLASAYAIYTVLASAWLIAQETYLFLNWHLWPAPDSWQAAALFTIACLWSIHALAMFTLGRYLRNVAFRFTAFIVAALATVLPLWAGLMMPATTWTPFWNLRWLSYLVVAPALGLLAWMIAREEEKVDISEIQALGVLPGAAGLLVLWGMSLEIYFSFKQWMIPSPDTWAAAAFFTIATLCGLFGVVMLLLGLIWEHHGLRLCAYGAGVIGLVALLLDAVTSTHLNWAPVANLRFMAFALLSAAVMLAVTLMQRHAAKLGPPESLLSTSLGAMSILIVLWGLTQETYETFYYFRAALGPHWNRSAQMAISLVWTVGGTLLLVGGIARRYQPARVIALSLLALTVLKVFGFDLSFLDLPPRILSFGGLGAGLIFISWLYSRFGVGTDAPEPLTNGQEAEV